MHKILCSTLLALAPVMLYAQQGGSAPHEEKATPIQNGGIFVPGWKATVDAGAIKQGQSEKDSSFKAEAGGFHIMTGPALTYWDTKKSLKGDYTVSATFTEAQYMNRNDHPHPYGIAIAGESGNGLYCAAYGNGTFIVRGFSPDAFQMGGRRPEANDAIHKAAGPGQPVTQTIAMQVKGDKVSCMVNGTTVASYNKTDVVADGKLKSTDGFAGIRMAHNTDVMVKDFKITK
ncbi:hypothetical protein [Terriglobus sp. RCC_193]|uniref:hypothetical protein n=1 Tax=Terriglobus sp. RCC_193 TaxID=3239218 RepID=UPI0035254584